MKPIAVVVCAIMQRKKILLVKKNNRFGNLWTLPSSRVADGEQLSVAVIRTGFEDTGYTSEMVSMLGIVSEEVLDDDSAKYLLNVCRVRIKEGHLDPETGIEARWFSPNHIPKDVLASDKEIIKRMVMKQEATYYTSVLKKIEDEYRLDRFAAE